MQHEVFKSALEKLNDAQRTAVNTIEGPVLVVAGPGTGKTQILAARIGQILTETDTQPQNILCLTYTDAGTIAMRTRLRSFIGDAANYVDIYTFHAFCNTVIQQHPKYFGRQDLEQITDLENTEVLREIIDSLTVGHPLKRLTGDVYFDARRLNNLFALMKKENWSDTYVMETIDAYLEGLEDREDFQYKRANKKKGIEKGDPNIRLIEAAKEKMVGLRAGAALFPKYVDKLKELGRYDYADMILWVQNAFEEHEDLLLHYQEQYHYFLVDEFQDTNGAQSQILQQLINYWDVPNVFAVGDDDQSIFEFQGARVKNIIDFQQQYKNWMQLIVLTQNYRSNQPILDGAKAVIEHNKDRLVNQLIGLDKTLIASNESFSKQTHFPIVNAYENEFQQEISIADAIEKAWKAGSDLNDVGVIYMQHKQVDGLVTLLKKRQIPYRAKKKENVLEVPEVQQLIDILTYLSEEKRLLHAGEFLLFKMVHFPYFKFTMRDIAVFSAKVGRNYRIKWREAMGNIAELNKLKIQDPYAFIGLNEKLYQWQLKLPIEPLPQLLEIIMNDSGFLDHIAAHDDKIFLLQAVKRFFDFVQEECRKQPRLALSDFLKMLVQMEEEGIGLPIDRLITQRNAVQLMTAHGSKGLEFETVYLMGCNKKYWEGKRGGGSSNFSLPDTLTYTGTENKEEAARRLFYVGMTRAKKDLFISYAKHTNDDKEIEKSQFVDECIEQSKVEINHPVLSRDLMEASLLATLETREELYKDEGWLDELLKDFKMSVTHLNTYMECPKRYYYEYILKMPRAYNEYAGFGTAIHKAIETTFEKMMAHPNKEWPSEKEVMSFFFASMKKNEYAFTAEQYERRKLYGEQILPAYYNLYKDEWIKTVTIEYIMDATADGVPIKGMVDKIEFDGNDCNLVDYKTGAYHKNKKKLAPPSDNDPAGGVYWRQVVFYKILMDNQRKKPWKMVSGELDFVEKDTKEDRFVKHKIEILPEHIDLVKKQIKSAYDSIMNHEFEESCGECRICKGG